MLARTTLLSVAMIVGSSAVVHVAAAETPEWVRVINQACGSDPQEQCLNELRNICHEHPTFRCYYSQKRRFDAIRQAGFPEGASREEDW